MFMVAKHTLLMAARSHTSISFTQLSTERPSQHSIVTVAGNESSRSDVAYSTPAGAKDAMRSHSERMPSKRWLLLCGNNADPRFDPFKTQFVAELERRRVWPQQPMTSEITEVAAADSAAAAALPPVERYFDALEGPELETLRASEKLTLPEGERWPFLLRFPISCFGMCLGLASQTVLWKTIATSPATAFLHVAGRRVSLALWCFSVALTAVISLVYFLKLVVYFEAVRREYRHPVRANFFYAPWMSLLLLAHGAPPFAEAALHHPAAWYVLIAPVFILDVMVFGEWMSGGERRLSRVANPSVHLPVAGNFVGALFGASTGLKDGPLFFFAVGLVHYLVVFVTLHQRLPTNEALSKELHPVFFLFVAAPSIGSLAWTEICGGGGFDRGAKLGYFVAVFLYVSLVARVNQLFRGFRFSMAWWAYTLPTASAATASVAYAAASAPEPEGKMALRVVSVVMSSVSAVTLAGVFAATMYHALVRRDLFPNDVAIAITERKL